MTTNVDRFAQRQREIQWAFRTLRRCDAALRRSRHRDGRGMRVIRKLRQQAIEILRRYHAHE